MGQSSSVVSAQEDLVAFRIGVWTNLCKFRPRPENGAVQLIDGQGNQGRRRNMHFVLRTKRNNGPKGPTANQFTANSLTVSNTVSLRPALTSWAVSVEVV
jgi:hypothetical protein